VIFVLISGIVLASLALFVLRAAFRIRGRLQANLVLYGIREALPMDRDSALIMLG
jgi:hypothetical protein